MILGKFTVSGHSMEPYLHEGDTVLASGILPIRVHDVVVVKRGSKKLIKRISQVKKTSVFLEGDNKRDSLDSRTFGEIRKKDIIGKVILKI